MPHQDAIRDFYRDNPRMVSSPFGGVEGINTALFTDVLARLDISLAGMRVLDIGCGRGYAEEVTTALGGHYTGTDFVASRGGFRFALGDAARLPFPDAAFDVAFCIDASEHFPEPERAAAEVFRVLRTGGRFFLSAPNYANVAGLVKWTCEVLGLYAPQTWAPFGRWQAQEFEQPLTSGRIRRLYTAAGFRDLRAIGHAPEVCLGLFPWIDHPKMPGAIRFRLQRLFLNCAPPLVRIFPATSLHLFWRMTRP